MFSIKDFFSKCDQIRRKLQIWSHLRQKSLTETFIFCAMKSVVLSADLEAYLLPCQIYMIELPAKIVKGVYLVTIFAISPIIDV